MAFPTGYTLYQNVTINNIKVDATLTDYPCLVDLSDLSKAGADIFDTCRSDGGDIRCTLSDGTTQLAREVVSIDTTGKTGELHVKIPSLASSTDTVIRIWYNGSDTEPAEDSTYGKENTWSSDYAMVHHMDDTTTSTITDSTNNNNDGTKVSANDPIEATGIIGKGQDFNGSTSQISCGSGASIGDIFSGGGTISFHMNAAGWGEAGYGRVINKGISGANNEDTQIYLRSPAGEDKLTLSRDFSTVNPRWDTPTGSLSLSTDYLVHVIYNESSTANNPAVYFNGVSQTITEITSPSGTAVSDAARTLKIGSRGGDREFDGVIDELRFISTELTSTWLTTEYNNQSSPSTFYSVSDEQGGGGSSILPIIMNYNQKMRS